MVSYSNRNERIFPSIIQVINGLKLEGEDYERTKS